MQGMRKADNVHEADIPLATLDTANVVSVQTCELCEVLLREPLVDSQSTKMPTEQYTRIGATHSTVIICL